MAGGAFMSLPSAPPENLYRQAKAHIERMPDFSKSDNHRERIDWGAKALAIAQEFGDVTLSLNVSNNVRLLADKSWGANAGVETYAALKTIVERLELRLPASLSGAFIAAGSVFDAHAAFSKVVSGAKSDVLLIDPYMDEKALTEFGESVPQGITYRLLADQAFVKPSLAPAARKWKQQHGTSRPLEVRLANPKALHDRLIIVDQTNPWTVTQSLNQIAVRSHAEFVLALETADLKIPAYAEIWTNAAPMPL
jgi:hypothetical protein